MTKKIVILGSTGSIGRQALQVVDEDPGEYEVVALAAGTDFTMLSRQIQKYRPRLVAVANHKVQASLESLLSENNSFGENKIEMMSGEEGLANLAGLSGIDIILIAVNGIHGLKPAMKALEQGTQIALANKETLVMAGALVMEKARVKGAKILPVDSEHSAIFQCLEDHNRKSIDKILLTASGGPFLHHSKEQLEHVKPEEALKHPRWQMGKKITVDSASLINKGLEVIEAHWLFDVSYDQVEVVVHPQSIIHSMVAYVDGAVLAQMGSPDMRIPIQYAFTYPYRKRNTFPKVDFCTLKEITFAKPDTLKFPGLALAYEAGRRGGTLPAVFNAANEIAVEHFLQARIPFTAIPVIIEKVMNQHQTAEKYSLDDIIAVDEWARRQAAVLIPKFKG